MRPQPSDPAEAAVLGMGLCLDLANRAGAGCLSPFCIGYGFRLPTVREGRGLGQQLDAAAETQVWEGVRPTVPAAHLQETQSACWDPQKSCYRAPGFTVLASQRLEQDTGNPGNPGTYGRVCALGSVGLERGEPGSLGSPPCRDVFSLSEHLGVFFPSPTLSGFRDSSLPLSR